MIGALDARSFENQIEQRLEVKLAHIIKGNCHDKRASFRILTSKFVSTAKNMAALIMPMIEPVGISAQKPAQSGHQIAFRRFDHQMKMVFHQTKGMNLEAGFLASLGQGLDEIMTIPVIQKDGFPTISPAQDMIDRAGILNAYLTWHQSILPQKRMLASAKTGTYDSAE